MLRDLTWGGVRLLPGTSARFGPPRRLRADVRAWIATQPAGFGYVELEPPSRADRPAPTSIYGAGAWQSRQWHASTAVTTPAEDFPAAFVATLPGARLLGADGTVLTHDDALLGQVSVDAWAANHGDAAAHAARRRFRLPAVRRRPGRVASLAVLSGQNYFHWMLHLLPRLDLLRRAGHHAGDIDWYAVNALAHPFQAETLSTMGIPRDRVLELADADHLEVDVAVVPSRISRMSDMPGWACSFVRSTFLPPRDGRPRPDKLYLTRGRAGHRTLRNEPAVREALERLGFTTVAPETMTVAEQARTLHAARVVVSAHGAALTNLVFCRRGTTVVELFNPRYINGCYWMLSTWVGARYHYLLGIGDQPTGARVPIEPYGDLEVDVDALSHLLRKADP